MKIALFTETYLPNINGVATHVASLKSGLESLGHEVLIVTASTTVKHHTIKDGVLLCPSKSLKKLYGLGLAAPLSKSRLKLLRDFDPDIIHVHTEFGVGLSGVHIAKILEKPLIYTLHTMYDEYIYYVAPKFFIPIMTKLAHGYFRMIAKKAIEVTGPSPKVQEYLDICKAHINVHVIPNPVELEKFTPNKIDIKEKKDFLIKYGIPENATVCCFVGRLGKEKSVDVLLKFWKEKISTDDNIYLIIIGDGPEKESLENLSYELGMNKRCVFTGGIAHDEIPKLYKYCDIYVTASVSDTNSISMLEGMASGLPVLQITDKLNEGQIQDGVNGYVFIDAEDLFEKIQRIKNMTHEELKELKSNTRKSVESSGCNNLGRNLEEIYTKARSVTDK